MNFYCCFIGSIFCLSKDSSSCKVDKKNDKIDFVSFPRRRQYLPVDHPHQVYQNPLVHPVKKRKGINGRQTSCKQSNLNELLKKKVDKTEKKVVRNEYLFHLYQRFGIIFSSLKTKPISHRSIALFATDEMR